MKRISTVGAIIMSCCIGAGIAAAFTGSWLSMLTNITMVAVLFAAESLVYYEEIRKQKNKELFEELERVRRETSVTIRTGVYDEETKGKNIH